MRAKIIAVGPLGWVNLKYVLPRQFKRLPSAAVMMCLDLSSICNPSVWLECSTEIGSHPLSAKVSNFFLLPFKLFVSQS